MSGKGSTHLLKRRKKYQSGSFTKRQRKTGPPVWEFCYTDPSQQNAKQHVIFSTIEYPTKRDVQKAVQPILLRVNGSQAYRTRQEPTFGDLVERFIREERLREIKAQPAGQTETEGLRYSTAGAYLSNLQRHILPRWGSMTIASVRAGDVLEWLQGVRTTPRTIGVASRPLSPKSRGHLKALMGRLFEKAMLWGLIDLQRNPMELVEVRGVSKRRKKPEILTVKQYQAISAKLPDPYRTMFTVAICLGLRVNEILALKWSDFDFDAGTVRVQRGVVHGRISGVKTEYSEDDLPIHPAFATILLDWLTHCARTEDGWVFPNPNTGNPYHAETIQQDYLRPAGEAIGLSWSVGWHTARHTYRSLLDDAGAPIGVQQKLMRHAQVSTTMDIYGSAYLESKRVANGNVVDLILTAQKGSQIPSTI